MMVAVRRPAVLVTLPDAVQVMLDVDSFSRFRASATDRPMPLATAPSEGFWSLLTVPREGQISHDQYRSLPVYVSSFPCGYTKLLVAWRQCRFPMGRLKLDICV